MNTPQGSPRSGPSPPCQPLPLPPYSSHAPVEWASHSSPQHGLAHLHACSLAFLMLPLLPCPVPATSLYAQLYPSFKALVKYTSSYNLYDYHLPTSIKSWKLFDVPLNSKHFTYVILTFIALSYMTACANPKCQI